MGDFSIEWGEGRILLVEPPTDPTSANIEAYYDELERVVQERGGKFAIMTDTTKLTRIPSALERKTLIARSDELDAKVGVFCSGAAVLVRNPLLRTALSAVRWFMKGDTPTEFFREREPAVRYCREQLALGPATIPPGPPQ